MDAATKRWIIVGVVAWAGVAALNVARAQMVDEPTCYSWEGGHKSAGSFHKCGPRWEAPAKKAPPPPPVASPIMMPMAAPVVQQTCAPPPPKPVLRKKPKPKPLKC